MGGDVANVEMLLPKGPFEGDEHSEAAYKDDLLAELRGFDVRSCSCTVPEDKDLFLGIIEAAYYGLPAFNVVVKGLIMQLEPTLAAALAQRANTKGDPRFPDCAAFRSTVGVQRFGCIDEERAHGEEELGELAEML